MGHNISLITTLVYGFSVALILGFIAVRVKSPPLVGYLLAGIVIGPATPGFVADVQIASQLSEIGVMLLMLGVGLHFSIDDLLAVKRIAIPGAVVQMLLATLLGMLVARWWGWRWHSGLVFGLSLSCASTVVLLKVMEARDALDTINGRIAVGWLIVEDLVTVLVLVLLPSLAEILGGSAALPSMTQSLWWAIGQTLLKVAAFIGLMLIVGRRMLPWLLWQVSRTGSRELFTLSVIASAIGVAYGASELFGASFALGAFFAGMVMRESEFSHRAAKESLPLRDAFSVLFFVSMGMLFVPNILLEQPVHVLGVVAIIILGKSIVAFVLVLAFRYSLHTALMVSASLAQIGEFSFILAGLGLKLGLLPTEGMSLILAGALISIALNPLLFAIVESIKQFALRYFALACHLEQRREPNAELPASTERRYLAGQVVLVGYGRVGRRIAKALDGQDIPYVVVERNRELVEAMRKKGIAAVTGDAAEPAVLIQAHIADAAMLVVAIPDARKLPQMLDTARSLNPGIEVILRTHCEDELQKQGKEHIESVLLSNEELAKSMSAHILERVAPRSS